MTVSYLFADNCDSVSADIVFVVDNSGSIADTDQGSVSNWQLMLNFIIGIVQEIEISPTRNRVGMVTFGNSGKNEFFMNDYENKAALIDAINRTEYLGENTNTSGGLRVMREQQFLQSRGDRSTVENIAIVITDGKSTYDNQSTIPEAMAARADGIQIFAVGVTASIDVEEVMLMSSLPQLVNRNYFLTEDFQDINSVMVALIEETCQASGIGECGVQGSLPVMVTVIRLN